MAMNERDRIDGIELKMAVTLADGEEVTAIKVKWDRESQGLTVMANSGLTEVTEGFLKDAIPLVMESINNAKQGLPSSNLYVTPSTKLQ